MECYLWYFFFSSRRRHTRYWRDWSSDVCSSDLAHRVACRSSKSRVECRRERTIEHGSAAQAIAISANNGVVCPAVVLCERTIRSDSELPDCLPVTRIRKYQSRQRIQATARYRVNRWRTGGRAGEP